MSGIIKNAEIFQVPILRSLKVKTKTPVVHREFKVVVRTLKKGRGRIKGTFEKFISVKGDGIFMVIDKLGGKKRVD